MLPSTKFLRISLPLLVEIFMAFKEENNTTHTFSRRQQHLNSQELRSMIHTTPECLQEDEAECAGHHHVQEMKRTTICLMLMLSLMLMYLAHAHTNEWNEQPHHACK